VFGLGALLVSYFGATAFGGNDDVPGPWDSMVVAAVGAVGYVAGVYSSVSHLRAHPSAESEPAVAPSGELPADGSPAEA
jgi:hypothetical protein